MTRLPALAYGRLLSDVEPEHVTWLSPNRIPLGKLAILEGDPGVGKSMMLLDLAARVTQGQGFPGDPAFPPAHVTLLTAEDGLADTVRPRLEAAGADCRRIHALEGFVRQEDETFGEITLGDPNNPESLEALEECVERYGSKLVIVDVLTAYLSGARDTYRDHDIRQALRPLAALAERTSCAIVAVRHLKKSAGSKAIYAGGGSIAMAGAARAVLLVEKDPADAERRVLAVTKCNLAPLPPSLLYRIETGQDGAPRIVWLGQSEHTADSLIEARATEEGEGGQRSRIAECADCLQEWLTGAGLERREVLRLGREAGFAERMIERASQRLGVVHRSRGFGSAKRSWWELPPIPTATPNSDSRFHMTGIVGIGGIDGNGRPESLSEEAFERAVIASEGPQ